MRLKRMWWKARAGWRRAALVVLTVAVAVGGALVPLSVHVTSHGEYPGARPDALAHLLADYSAHPQLGSWRVLEESGNYTQWRYRVSLECGARCAGEARVHAAAPAPEARRRAHRVTLRRELCWRAPLLPWPPLCEEVYVEWEVRERGPGQGSGVRERARARCGAWRVLAGACAAELRALRREHDAALRAALF